MWGRISKDQAEWTKGAQITYQSCDGIPVSKSNNAEIWPIQCQTIELSPSDRERNICVPCLWVSNSKPNMIKFNCFSVTGQGTTTDWNQMEGL